jgi:hypothetical protein
MVDRMLRLFQQNKTILCYQINRFKSHQELDLLRLIKKAQVCLGSIC